MTCVQNVTTSLASSNMMMTCCISISFTCQYLDVQTTTDFTLIHTTCLGVATPWHLAPGVQSPLPNYHDQYEEVQRHVFKDPCDSISKQNG